MILNFMVILIGNNFVLTVSFVWFIMKTLMLIFVLNVIVGLNQNAVTLAASIALIDWKCHSLTGNEGIKMRPY